MSWGGLNPALTSWRNGINDLFPGRSTKSDGGVADANHSSSSQHQRDKDGTVDAFDMDVNLLNSGVSTGSPDELALIEALKQDWRAGARAHLWIHNRQIAQHDSSNWKRWAYTGPSPHTEHAHWESHEQNEGDGSPWTFIHTKALLEDMMALDYDQTKQAARDGAAEWWAAEKVGKEDISPETALQRVHKSITNGTGDTAALWQRLDELETVGRANAEALARIEAALPPPPSE